MKDFCQNKKSRKYTFYIVGEWELCPIHVVWRVESEVSWGGCDLLWWIGTVSKAVSTLLRPHPQAPLGFAPLEYTRIIHCIEFAEEEWRAPLLTLKVKEEGCEMATRGR